MTIRRFEDIESWQLGREISVQVYELARVSGLGKDFSLKDQMLRSAGSIMDNIAEGFDAGSNREFVKFLQYAKRSCSELSSQLYRAFDQGYLNEASFVPFFDRISNARGKIGSFIQYLSKNLEQRTVTQSFEPQAVPASSNRKPVRVNRERKTGNSEPRTGN